MSWMEQSACRDASPDVFFPASEPGATMYETEVAQARFYCNHCPVREQCLITFMNEAHGVFGGFDPVERQILRLAPTA